MNIEKDEKRLNEKVQREFKLTTLSLNNKTSVFLLTLVVILFGFYSYRNMPKELFPDIAFPWIMVQTVYPGNSPADIENLVTRPIEKEIENIQGIDNISSTSSQDISFVMVEFNPDENIDKALDEVKDAVDKAKSELPDDLPNDPEVDDIDMSEFPILNINLYGDYSTDELKKYAELLEDRIETVSEISKVEITGINEREIQINTDLHNLQAFQMNFDDIENAVAYENMSMSAGEIITGRSRKTVRVLGEFDKVKNLEDIIVKREKGNIIYLRDVAEVVDGYEDPSSFTRLNGKPVVSLQIVKKGGENLLSATRKIKDILNDVREDHLFPEDLKYTITNDQSEMVEMQLSNLENSMVMSIIFVVIVLFMFLGTRNALFVGLAIPLSMFLSFIILELIDFRVNMIVLFSLILALGMLVDNAIVVVENIYRFVDQGYKKWDAAKQAVGEIAVPIIISTATTLAAFFPLIFWQDITGEFMKFLPITLIVVLLSSLFVALVIIPVFSSTFIKKEDHKPVNTKRAIRFSGVFISLAILFYLTGVNVVANILLLALFITLFNLYFLDKAGKWFKNIFLVKLEHVYERVLTFSLRGWNPVWFMLGTILLLIFTLVLMAVRKPNVLFFPENEPDYINILAELPVGSNIYHTENFSKQLEADVDSIIAPYKHIIESKLVNIGDGAVLENEMDFASNRDNKCLITLSFVDYEDREDLNTSNILKKINKSLSNQYPGVLLRFQKNDMGPPTGRQINIEVAGQDYEKLINLTDTLMQIIEKSDIEGIEALKMDLDIGMPEILVRIDRDKARRFEMSTAQIASSIRTSIYGKEISNFKEGEEEYPIQLRFDHDLRNNITDLMNQKITFMNQQGQTMEVPVSAVAEIKESSTYGAVKRKDLNRVITVYSNVLEGYNANNINNQLRALLDNFNMPEGYTYQFTGEQEDQQDSMKFLSNAMLIALSLILLILVTQFNSIVKPFIILGSVIFSTIGVFGGIATFKMDFIVVMTGIGIVALAGVVVNNAIVLLDYIELLKQRQRKHLDLKENDFLPVGVATDCILKGGKTRLRPVLLTAITTILGLIPLAIGLNIDFIGLLTEFKPNIYMGGNMSMIWSPISWTIIFGLTFSTFLTLIIVPVMYRIVIIIQKKGIHLTEKINQQLSTNGNKE